MRPCFTFTASANGSAPTVLAIDDEIGFWGTQAADFRDQLNRVSGDLTLEINSVGGDVFAGLGMYNMLRTFAASGRKVTTRITGLAASIASIVALAADTREMPSNAFAMVHAVSSGVWGTADEIRNHADATAKIHESLRNIYMDRMGVDEATATEMMSKNTWLTAQECLDMGFATALIDPVEATAKFSMDRADLPVHVAAIFKSKVETDPPNEPAEPTQPTDPAQPTEPTAPDTPVAEAIVAHAKTLGLEAHGAHFALKFDTLEGAKAQMAVAREITALCAVVNKKDAATRLIREGKNLAEARAALTDILAAGDTHVDNHPKNSADPTGDASAKPSVASPTSLWASHNSQTKKGR